MKRIKIGCRGLTLMELILATSLLSVILLATSSVSLSAARLTATIGEEVRLQNEVNYLLREIELNIKSGRDPVISTAISLCPNAYPCSTLTVTDPDGNLISYHFVPVAGSILRRINGMQQSQILQGAFPASLIRAPGGGLSSIFSTPSSRVVEINLYGSRTLRNGRTISTPLMTKSILLRGAN